MSAPTLRERLTANLKDLLDADGRTRDVIATAAFWEKPPATADRHLRAVVSRGWASPEDLDSLARVLGVDVGELFREAAS